MKVNAFKLYPHTAQRRAYTTTQDEDSGLVKREYFDAEAIKCRLITPTQGAKILYTDAQLQRYDLLYDFADIAGNLIMGHATVYVAGFVPVTNAYGFADGYAYSLSGIDSGGLTLPNSVDA